MKCWLLIFFLFLSFLSFSQKSDFFLLKKQSGKTVKSFYSGTYISFMTTGKEHYSGYIKKVANDSVWVEYQQIFRGMTPIGSILLDTVTYQARRFSVKDIAFIEKDKKGFEQVLLSGLMKIGSAGYIVLHTVNGVIQKDRIDLGNLGIAAGVYAAGIVLNKLKKDYYYIGKRYRLQYIPLAG